MSSSDRSFADILKNVVSNVQEIIRAELRLAKSEVREELLKAKSAALLLAIGGLCGIFSALFILVAAVYGLSRVVPDWAAALVVSVVLAIATVLMLGAATKRFQTVRPVPEQTIESLKENAKWVKQQTK